MRETLRTPIETGSIDQQLSWYLPKVPACRAQEPQEFVSGVEQQSTLGPHGSKGERTAHDCQRRMHWTRRAHFSSPVANQLLPASVTSIASLLRPRIVARAPGANQRRAHWATEVPAPRQEPIMG